MNAQRKHAPIVWVGRLGGRFSAHPDDACMPACCLGWGGFFTHMRAAPINCLCSGRALRFDSRGASVPPTDDLPSKGLLESELALRCGRRRGDDDPIQVARGRPSSTPLCAWSGPSLVNKRLYAKWFRSCLTASCWWRVTQSMSKSLLRTPCICAFVGKPRSIVPVVRFVSRASLSLRRSIQQ